MHLRSIDTSARYPCIAKSISYALICLCKILHRTSLIIILAATYKFPSLPSSFLDGSSFFAWGAGDPGSFLIVTVAPGLIGAAGRTGAPGLAGAGTAGLAGAAGLTTPGAGLFTARVVPGFAPALTSAAIRMLWSYCNITMQPNCVEKNTLVLTH